MGHFIAVRSARRAVEYCPMHSPDWGSGSDGFTERRQYLAELRWGFESRVFGVSLWFDGGGVRFLVPRLSSGTCSRDWWVRPGGLESVSGATPHEFKSRILCRKNNARQADSLFKGCFVWSLMATVRSFPAQLTPFLGLPARLLSPRRARRGVLPVVLNVFDEMLVPARQGRPPRARPVRDDCHYDRRGPHWIDELENRNVNSAAPAEKASYPAAA